MVVQHNLTAMNSNRMLGITTGTQAKSTEKLSSGYKINRAADDAAGLSISEKMRKQIRGLTQASLNAQDGISAVQTAEGALTEVHDMLQRMNELAVKAANGTNSVDDREYIQNEIDQLVTEIDRVAETTKFNETYLLKGNTKATQDTVAYSDVELEVTFEAKTAGAQFYAKDGADALEEAEIFAALEAGNTLYTGAASAQNEATGRTYEAAKLTAGTQSLYDDVGAEITDLTTLFDVAADGSVTVKDGVTLSSYYEDSTQTTVATLNNIGIYVTGEAEKYTGDFANLYAKDGTTALTEEEAKAAVKNGDTLYTDAAVPQTAAKEGTDYTYVPASKPALYDANGNKISENGLDSYIEIKEDGTYAMKDGKELYKDAEGKVAFDITADAESYLLTNQTTAALDLDLHVGADATENNQISMKIDAMSAEGLGVDDLKVNGPTDENALNAIETIKAAIQRVSTQRSALGAIQNRLEHTINNVDNVVENTTSAESQIRDTDMASEMVKYSNNNILAQAGQAMLAQANQANQGVLSLLG